MPSRRDRLLVDESPRRDVDGITTEGGDQAFDVVVAVNARPAMPAIGTPAMRNGFMAMIPRVLLSMQPSRPPPGIHYKIQTRVLPLPL